MFWNPSLSCLSMYLLLQTLLFCLLLFSRTHFALCSLFSVSVYSPFPAVISDSSLHWHFLCFFWIPWTLLHLLVRSLLFLSNTRSEFFCVLFPPLVLIYHFFSDISPFSFLSTPPFNLSTAFCSFPHIHPPAVPFTHQLSLNFPSIVINGNSVGWPNTVKPVLSRNLG